MMNQQHGILKNYCLRDMIFVTGLDKFDSNRRCEEILACVLSPNAFSQQCHQHAMFHAMHVDFGPCQHSVIAKVRATIQHHTSTS